MRLHNVALVCVTGLAALLAMLHMAAAQSNASTTGSSIPDTTPATTLPVTALPVTALPVTASPGPVSPTGVASGDVKTAGCEETFLAYIHNKTKCLCSNTTTEPLMCRSFCRRLDAVLRDNKACDILQGAMLISTHRPAFLKLPSLPLSSGSPALDIIEASLMYSQNNCGQSCILFRKFIQNTLQNSISSNDVHVQILTEKLELFGSTDECCLWNARETLASDLISDSEWFSRQTKAMPTSLSSDKQYVGSICRELCGPKHSGSQCPAELRVLCARFIASLMRSWTGQCELTASLSQCSFVHAINILLQSNLCGSVCSLLFSGYL